MPVHAAQGNLLIDDEIDAYFRELTRHAKAIAIIGSCFSGIITRGLYVQQKELRKIYDRGG